MASFGRAVGRGPPYGTLIGATLTGRVSPPKPLFYAQRTVNALDMDSLCLVSDALLPHFKELKDQIEDFVA